jgi:predicted nucleic acid-binding protein
VATLIDASVLIAAERGALDLYPLLSTVDDEIVLSAITATELLHGVYRAVSDKVRRRREQLIEQLFETFTIIPFDLVAARLHARIWADLAARGVNVGPHDLLIGATALTVDAAIATRDLRSFPKIPDLKILRW